MSRFALFLAPFSFFSLLVACGGAVATIPDDNNAGGSSSSSSSGGSSSGGGGIHCSPPACDRGDIQVGSSPTSCPYGVNCYSRVNACGTAVWCVHDEATCDGYPSCEPGYVQVSACPGGSGIDCKTVSVCGSTISCLYVCEGPRPICDPGDVEVPSCPQDAPCYSRSTCNFTIWCVPGLDASVPPPPPFTP